MPSQFDKLHAFYANRFPAFVMWNSPHPTWGGTYLTYWSARVDAFVHFLAQQPMPQQNPPPPSIPGMAASCLHRLQGQDFWFAILAFLKTFATPKAFTDRFAASPGAVPWYSWDIPIGFAEQFDAYIARNAASDFVIRDCQNAAPSPGFTYGAVAGPSVPAECWDVPGFKDLHAQAIISARDDAASWFYSQDSGADPTGGICYPGMEQAECEQALFDYYFANLVNLMCNADDLVGDGGGDGGAGPGIPIAGTPCTSGNNIVAAQIALRQWVPNLATDGVWGPKSAAALAQSGQSFESLVPGCTPPIPSYKTGAGAAVQPGKDGGGPTGGLVTITDRKEDKKESSGWVWGAIGAAAAVGLGVIVYTQANKGKDAQPAYASNPTRQSPLRQVKYTTVERDTRGHFSPHRNIVITHRGHTHELLGRGPVDEVYVQGDLVYVLGVTRGDVSLTEYRLDSEPVDANDTYKPDLQVISPWADVYMTDWKAEEAMGKRWERLDRRTLVRRLMPYLGDYIG